MTADQKQKLARGWGIWALGIAIFGGYLYHQAWLVVPTASGIEFQMIGATHFLGAALLLLLTAVVGACAPPKDSGKWWLGCLALTILGWWGLGRALDEVTFVRTPPCWGVHSLDPGSGEGCLPGMRRDMTVDELRAFYRR